jgi:hypothetical protein
VSKPEEPDVRTLVDEVAHAYGKGKIAGAVQEKGRILELVRESIQELGRTGKGPPYEWNLKCHGALWIEKIIKGSDE